MELALMVASATAGFFQLEWWSAVVIGLLLTLLNTNRSIAFVRENTDVGSARVFALSFGASTVNNVIFAILTFVAGRAFALLVVG
jgi:hypothetical protein